MSEKRKRKRVKERKKEGKRLCPLDEQMGMEANIENIFQKKKQQAAHTHAKYFNMMNRRWNR